MNEIINWIIACILATVLTLVAVGLLIYFLQWIRFKYRMYRFVKEYGYENPNIKFKDTIKYYHQFVLKNGGDINS